MMVSPRQLPLTRAKFIGAMSAGLPGGVSAFLAAGWISASPDDASSIAWTHEPFVAPTGTLATLVTSYLTAATSATPAGLGMTATAAATQMTALFASAATQPN